MAIDMEKINYILNNDPSLRRFIDIVSTMSIEEKELLSNKIIEEKELLSNKK